MTGGELVVALLAGVVAFGVLYAVAMWLGGGWR